MTDNFNPTDSDFFLYFLKEKIDKGASQKDIANSEHVSISTSYINKLYKNPPKHVRKEIQISIAKYFEISLEQLLHEGKILFYQKNNRRAVGGDSIENTVSLYSEEKQLELLNLLINGIRQNHVELARGEELSKQFKKQEGYIDTLHTMINHIDLGITFFDSSNNFVLSNYKGKCMEGVELSNNDNIDTFLLATSQKIKSFQGLVKAVQVFKADKTKPIKLTVHLKTKEEEEFKIKGVYDKFGKFKGTLLLISSIG